MMNKLKFFFCLILCAAVFGGLEIVSAQSGDKVLIAAGKNSLKQSEFDTLVEFYEWMFDAQFTSGERERFREFIENDFRQNAATARKNANEVLGAFAKVRALDADGQRQTRDLAVPNFVADLRKTANDPDSQFLLDIYERGQNSGNNAETIKEVLPSEEDMREAEETSAPSSVGSRGGAGSSKLVGRWLRSGGAGGARDYTGKTLYNSGNDVIFEFLADGTMQFINDKNTLSITQCRITEMTKIPGRYSISGNAVTMNLGAGTVVSTSSCERAGNFKKTLSASTATKTFVVKRLDSPFRPDAPLILCFDGAKDDQCFEKTVK